MPSSRTWCRLAVLGAAVLFSTGGAAIKATTLTSWQVASFRSAIAALALAALVPAARRDWNRRVPLAGAAYAGTLITFVLANKLTTSANAVFLQSTGPLYLLALSPLLLKERVRARDLAVMALMAGGMALVLFSGQRELVTAPDPVRGNLLGAASGLAWAFTLVGLRWLSGSAMAVVVAGNVLACLAALPAALPLLSSTPTDWLVLGYLGVIQVGLAYWLMSHAVKHLPALEVSLLVLAEPALNPLWTLILHGERPASWAILGGALILAATLANLFRRTN